MTISDLISAASSLLQEAGIATARLDVLVLLEDVTGKDRGWLLAHPEFELDTKIATKLQKMVKKRAQHIPLAYIRGKTEFYGREFKVSPHTLEPRPESETMIELFRNLVKNKKYKAESKLQIADIGTGSGCLAITAKLEFPAAKVYATDINAAALSIAKKNAVNLHADIQFFEGDLFEPLSDINYQISIILANLPYVPDTHTINQAAMQEPEIAIFGGPDGLDLYRRLFTQLSEGRCGTPRVLTESLPFQHEELQRIAQAHGYTQVKESDFIQVFKYSA